MDWHNGTIVLGIVAVSWIGFEGALRLTTSRWAPDPPGRSHEPASPSDQEFGNDGKEDSASGHPFVFLTGTPYPGGSTAISFVDPLDEFRDSGPEDG